VIIALFIFLAEPGAGWLFARQPISYLGESLLRRVIVFTLVLAVLASASIFTRVVTGAADAATTIRSTFRQAVADATTGSTSITLPSWSPQTDELVLVGVVSQA
jgi:hypothetical protein